MKKIIKIITILITLIIVNYNMCFADMVAISNKELLQALAGQIVAIIGIIVIVTFIVSFFALKFTAKKSSNVNIEENKKTNKPKKHIYVWGVILIICVVCIISIILKFLKK